MSISVENNWSAIRRSAQAIGRPGLTVVAFAIGGIFVDGSVYAQTATSQAAPVPVDPWAASAPNNPGPTTSTTTSPKTAQNAGGATGDGFLGDVQDVVVTTGSRGGGRPVEKSLSPIDVITSDELLRTGKTNLREALSNLDPSYLGQAGYQGQQGEAVKVAALRGLDPKDTLVLVNGKRRHHSALFLNGQAPTDLDLIPASAVDHIEILKDGAAAQYGSDAIAGVINIILKKDAEGGSATIGYGQYGSSVGDHSGLKGRTGTALINQGIKLGNNGGFVNLSASLDLHKATNVYGDFPLSSSIYPKLANGQADPRETGLSRSRQIEGLPAGQNYSFAYNAELPINSAVTLYSNSTYAHRYSQGWGFYRTAISPQNYPSVYPNGYIPKFETVEDDFQSVVGIKGNDLLGWKWDLSTSYGSDMAKIYTADSINASLGPAFQNQHNFFDGRLVSGEWTTNLDVSREVHTPLLALPLTISGGLENRRETFSVHAGEWASYAQGTFVWPAGTLNAGVAPNPGASGMKGFDPVNAGAWQRTNQAVYLDFSQPITKKWTVDLAGRYEYYSDFGGVPSGKLSSRYEFNDAFSIRGTVSNGFSAPTLQQEHYSQTTGGYTTDPETGNLKQTFAQLATPNSATARAVGATDLKPEHSTNLSFGFVLKPLPRTSATMDFYSIDIRNRIAQTPTLQGSAVTSALAAAGITNVTSVTYFTNAAHTVTRGADLSIDHWDDIGSYGRLKWTLASTQNVTSVKSLAAVPNALSSASAGWVRGLTSSLTQYYPKNVTSLSANWRFKSLDVTVKETRYSKTTFQSATSPLLDQYVSAAFLTDLNIGYWLTKKARLSIGANNLFNRRPSEQSASAARLGSVPVSSPDYTWYAPYGNDGGFYYARLEMVW